VSRREAHDCDDSTPALLSLRRLASRSGAQISPLERAPGNVRLENLGRVNDDLVTAALDREFEPISGWTVRDHMRRLSVFVTLQISHTPADMLCDRQQHDALHRFNGPVLA
jgi:hypothetical protein